MPPSLPGGSFVWMLALWALALWNIRLVSAVPSTVTVNDQDPRIQYTPAQQWFHDPSKNWGSNSYNGSYTWTYGASAVFQFTGIGINITGPTGPDQALRMILLNNVSMGTCEPETADNEPATSFFSKLLDYGHYIVEVRHVDTRPNRTLTIEAFRANVDNDLYPSASGLNNDQPNLTINSVSVSSSNPSSTEVWSDPQAPSSPGIMALIITLPLLFLCVVCPIGTWLWMKRRHRVSREVSTDTFEKGLEPEQVHSRRNTPSNLSEFGVEALTIQEQLSAPPTMGPNMTAAMLDANGLVSAPSQRRQRTTTIPSGSAAGYQPGVSRQAMHTTDLAGHSPDEHFTALPTDGAPPSPPLVDRTESHRSRSPTAFFARLSQNFVAAFRSPSPQESAEVDGDTDDTSMAESYSAPLTLGVPLNHQPTATASSTLHGSDSEDGNLKREKLDSSVASHSVVTDVSTRAPSLSSHASLGHSQGSGGPRPGDPLPPSAPEIPSDISPPESAPGSAQTGQLSLSSASTGMVTALTHQTIDPTQ